jgi:outer membrane protein assembly factor BamA
LIILLLRLYRCAGRLVVAVLIAAPTLRADQAHVTPPAVVGDVGITGASAFSSRDILSWLLLRAGAPFSVAATDQAVVTITERYRSEGYLNVQVRVMVAFSADSALVNVDFAIEEHRRTLLGTLHVAGNSAVPASELLSLLDSQSGVPLDQSLLEADVAHLLAHYEKHGFPMARCSVDSLTFRAGDDVDSVSLTLLVDEGPRVTIEEVHVEGNVETDSDVIMRESRIRTGEFYDVDRMQAVRQRLLRLNIFSSVSEPELYLRNAAGGVLIRVQEGSTNTFDGIAGYMPGNGAEEAGYFTGLVSLSMRNLFGTARKLQFRWQKEDRHSHELVLGYVEPWLFGFPLNAGIEFQQRRQDTSYVRQGGNTHIEWMLSEILSVSLIGSAESVIPSADSTDARVPRSSTVSAGVAVVYDSRDDLYSPTGGARYRADYHYGRKNVDRSVTDPGTSGNVQRFTLDLDSYLTVFSRQVVALGIHGRQVQGGNIDESEYYRFGGANTLRGYRENQFLGTRIGWVNTEYRLLLARRSFVYAFLDAGYYARPASQLPGSTGSEAFVYGYGIGLRFDTPLGNLGVSFALGKGDSFAQGKVHFGIINEF